MVFTLATSLTYVGLSWLAADYFQSDSYLHTCAIGFSGRYSWHFQKCRLDNPLLVTEVVANKLYMLAKPGRITYPLLLLPGVIFALKVLTTHYERNPYTSVYRFSMPSKYAVWAELLIIHFLVPNASFIGHLAGGGSQQCISSRSVYHFDKRNI